MTDSPEPEIQDAAPEKTGFDRFAFPLAVIAGCVVYFALTRLFGVTIEEWRGVETFTDPDWFAAVVVAPIVSGMVVGGICGHHGKWYGMLPVGLIHPVDYTMTVVEGQVEVLHFGIFIFLLLVMLELALMAGWVAEVLRERLKGKEVRA